MRLGVPTSPAHSSPFTYLMYSLLLDPHNTTGSVGKKGVETPLTGTSAAVLVVLLSISH